ncbi:hypothetical protein RZS08_60440, partial [Arthrospira platensis SPKY1]|nr:hypothetical protein [Arthrospira platensis SPKY1]
QIGDPGLADLRRLEVAIQQVFRYRVIMFGVRSGLIWTCNKKVDKKLGAEYHMLKLYELAVIGRAVELAAKNLS